jgi:HEAT repeat protein
MSKQDTSFQTVLEALQDESKAFPNQYLKYFSDMDPDSIQSLLGIWERLTPPRKLTLLKGLESLVESDTLVSFEDLARALLGDANAGVRASSIRLLAESDDPKLVPTYINILQKDAELEPRLEAASLLGEYVLLGELEELDEGLLHHIEDALLAIANSDAEPHHLRRRALEALGYSSRLEVQTLIKSSFERQEPAWVASALVAMGRSSDQQWEDEVISMLINDEPNIRVAAIQAAGELSLPGARKILLDLLEEEEDEEVIGAAIWSLSEIGGEDVRAYLEALLDQTEDDESLEFLEDAIENLAFTEDMERFGLLAFDNLDIDSLDDLDEMEDEE